MKFYKKFHSLSLSKKQFFNLAIFCVLVFSFFINFSSLASAATGVPKVINFQGRLMDSSGNLLGGPTGTNYCYRFSIYSATTGGTKLWPAGTPSTMTILTREGVFDAPVGDVSAGGDSLTYDFQTSDTTFMNVEVNTTPGTCSGTWESLSPRPQIVSAAYAINSGTVQGLAPTQSASGNQLPQLTSDALVLGGTSAGVKSTSTNALTFNAGASGDVQFFSSANKITSGGALTIAGLMTSAGLTSSAPVNVTSQSATALTVARTGTNYALQVDTNTASSVTGLKVTSAAAGGGLAISVISSGTDENLTIDAKGAGSISIGGNSTGDVLLAGGAGATGCTIANSTGTLSCTVGITASAIRLDQITAATTSDTDNDNLNNNISWAWSTATTQTPLTLTANGSTTGSILSLTSSSAAATTGQKGLNVALTGALTGAQTTYGGYFSNTRTGASAVNVGLYATASGATGGNYAAIFDAGNVGIGTAAPQAQLEITGNFRLADQQTDTNASNGIIYKDGTPFIHNFRHATGGGARPNGNNTFVGLSAGNLTMGSTATVPYQASNNSGFGYQAFTSNTTGYYSSAFGFQALNSNTSGYSNSAFGMYALKLNDTGYSNSAMGIYALERNTSGYYNAALGYFAGGVIADGSTSNQTSNTSVYLGASTKALADGDSNEIVIGYNTTGFGSNTAAYGNSSITKHVFQTGEVMVGSTSDLGAYPLQVTGNAYVTSQIDFGSTGTGQGSLYKSGTAAILASTGTLQLNAGSGNRVQILVDNGARRAFYTTDGKFLFGGGSGETYGGIGSDNGTGALVFYYDDSSNSPNEAARFSSAGLFSTINNTITDTNSLFDLNLTLGNDATADTISALNIDVTSTATGADGDILYGINVANLTSADADVAESAIRVGTGWDNIFTSANASLTQAGALTVTSCTGCGGGGSTNWDTIGDPSTGEDINFGTTAQTITSTATTQNPLSLIGNSLTSGKLFSLTSTATAFTGNLANFTLSGSNAANTGSLVQVDNTGTSNANTSLLINHYATGTGNLAFRVNDVSGDTSPFVIDGNGNVGIGQASPNTQLHIGPGTDVSDVASTNLAVFQNNGSSSISVRDASSNSEGYLYSDAGGVSFGSVTSHAVQIGASGGSAIFIDVSNNVNIGGDTTPNSIFTVGGASEFQVDISGNTSLFGGADLRFIETGGGTDFVAFQAPASVATSVTWTLPNADSSGCLQSNGSGTLSIASCGGGGVAWSAITNPTGDLNLTFDAGEETVFTTNATTATAFSITSATLSSGTLLDLTVTGTAGISSQKALNISTSGAVTGSNSTYGAYISNTHTGASATSVGLYATASGGQTNYAAQFAGGIFQSGGFASFNIGSSVFGVASTTYPDYIFTINDGVIAIGDYNGPDLNNTYLLVDDTNSVISANASSGFVFGGSNFELYPTTTSGDGFYVSANTITTGKGITVQSSSLTSGALMDLTSTGTGALTGQKGLNISLSGANGTGAQTTYGAYLSNTKTGTSNNVGLYATASGGASNYAIDAGNAIRLSSATATESRIYSATGVGYFGVSETTAQANMYYNNNFITVATGSISLNTGGNEKVNIGTSATVINENSLDYDFRIEGDTDANLFFTDASTDRVAIGTNTPRNAFTLENNVGGTAIGSVTATAGDLSTEWNNISQFKIQNDRDLGGGNALAFFVSGTSNERKAFIQSGHSDGTNANNLGDLILNPFGGNIGIGGDLSPNALFSVGSTSQFQVNSSGAIAAATGITSSGTITFSGLGGAGTKCLQTDNSGVVTAAASACGSSPFNSSAGVITKATAGDVLVLAYGDAADTQLLLENTTNNVIPTVDVSKIDITGGTTGIVTDGVDGLSIAMEVGNGTANTNAGLNISIVPVNTPSGDETFNGLNIGNITSSAATENGIVIGSGWDSDIKFIDTTPTMSLADNGTLVLSDGSSTTNDIFQIGTATSRGNALIYGDLVLKGSTIAHSLTGIIDVFVYDTAGDSDSGDWRNSLEFLQRSWATETKDDGVGDACNIATDDRCGSAAFPRKAVLVTTASALYIFDAADNSLWMKFTQDGTYALGADTNNNPSGIAAQNGVIVVGTNGASSTGMYAFDFKQDAMYRYNTTNRAQADTNIGNRNSTTTYATNTETGFAILNNAVNDVSINMQTASMEGRAGTLIAPVDSQGGPLLGVTLIAAATDSGVSVINMGTRKVVGYSDATNDDYNQVYITKRGRMYATNETRGQLEEWRAVDTVITAQTNGTPTRWYDETLANNTPITLAGVVPVISTSPSALAVIERASAAREASAAGQIDAGDVVFVGTDQGLAEVHTSGGLLATASWSKITTKDSATPYMNGGVRSVYLFDDASGATSTNSAVGTTGTTRNPLDQAGATAPTFGANGIRGGSVNFNNNSYLCSDANADGTCDSDTDNNVSTTSFTVSMWFKHSTTAAADVLFERCYTPATPTAATGCAYAGMNASGNIVFGIDDDATWTTVGTVSMDDAITSSGTWNDGQWHHLLVTNTDTDICMYIDGRQAVACDSSLAATATLDGAQVLTIGGRCTGANCTTGDSFWDGEIDEFVWSAGATTSSGSVASAANRRFLDGRTHLIRPQTSVDNADITSSTTIGSSSQSYIPNSFAGLVLEITGGTGAGQTRNIISNTATTFTVYPAWSTTPDSTSDFRVSPSKLYGSTNNVTAIAVDSPTQINRVRNLYVGTNDGADGGGVSVFTNAGAGGLKTEVYSSDSGIPDDDFGTTWSGTGSDDMQAISSYTDTLVFATGAGLRTQRKDLSLKQLQADMFTAMDDVRSSLVASGLFGATQEVLGLGQGADLAEYYYSSEGLDAGDVVAINPDQEAGIGKSTGRYQKNLLGVISTKPGLILGPTAENAYAVALSGRVPVKVTTENGAIKVGDLLTSSSRPGYAMRATSAGAVIGRVLNEPYGMTSCDAAQSLDEVGVPEGPWVGGEEGDAAPSQEQSVTGVQCGYVMLFVGLGESLGKNVELLAQEYGALHNGQATVDGISTPVGTQQSIMAFLRSIKTAREEEGVQLESFFTDRIAAGVEILTPTLVADTISVAQLSGGVDDNIALVLNNGSFTVRKTKEETPVMTLDALGNAVFNGKITASEIEATKISGFDALVARITALETLLQANAFDALTSVTTQNFKATGTSAFEGEAQFKGLSFFTNTTTFNSDVLFSAPVEFTLPPIFNKDTAGFALIREGDRRVRVVFDQPYVATPVINTTVTFDAADNFDDAAADSFFMQDVRHVVVEKDQTGFTILLNKTAPRTIRFSWVALGVKDPKIVESLVEGLVIEIQNEAALEQTPSEEQPEGGEPEVEEVAPTEQEQSAEGESLVDNTQEVVDTADSGNAEPSSQESNLVDVAPLDAPTSEEE